MPTLSPPPFATLVAVVLCALAGYYVGKTSGLRAAERIHDLNKKNPVLDDNFTASGTDKSTSTKDKGKGKAKVDEGDDGEWQSEDEGEDEEDGDGGVNIKKFENSHEACKMVSIPFLPNWERCAEISTRFVQES